MANLTSKELFTRYYVTKDCADWSAACHAKVRETFTMEALEIERLEIERLQDDLAIRLADLKYHLECLKEIDAL